MSIPRAASEDIISKYHWCYVIVFEVVAWKSPLLLEFNRSVPAHKLKLDTMMIEARNAYIISQTLQATF
jgi:hypothetical protein